MTSYLQKLNYNLQRLKYFNLHCCPTSHKLSLSLRKLITSCMYNQGSGGAALFHIVCYLCVTIAVFRLV